jgi:hypothetical protein
MPSAGNIAVSGYGRLGGAVGVGDPAISMSALASAKPKKK